MSESNSPSDVENQEPNNEPEQTEPYHDVELNSAVKEDLSHPSDKETQLDSAMREKDSLTSDTLVPPPDHGWLEQFEAFGLKAFNELEAVAIQGLVATETDLLISLAVKLLKLARVHDPDAFYKASLEQHD